MKEKEDQLKQIVHIQQQSRAKAKKQLMHDISLLLAEYDSEQHESLQQSMYDIQSSLRSNGVSLDDLSSDNNQDVEQLIASEKATAQVAQSHRQKMWTQLDSFITVRSLGALSAYRPLPYFFFDASILTRVNITHCSLRTTLRTLGSSKSSIMIESSS